MSIESSAPSSFLTYAPAKRRRKPSLWPTLLFLLYLLLIPYALGYAIYYPTYHYFTAGPTIYAHVTNYQALIHTPEFRLGSLFILVFFNMLPLPALLYFSRRPAAAHLALRKSSLSPISCIIFVLGGVALAQIGGSILYDAHLHSPALAYFAQLIHQAFHSAPFLCLFIIGFLGPIAEELLFRGYIQSRLIRRLGPLLGILLTSIAFGLFHRDLYQGLFAFSLGLFQGTVTYRAQSVLPAILIHIAINTTSVLVTFTGTSPAYHSLPINMAACVIFPASLYLLIKLRSPLPAYLRTPLPPNV